MSTACCCWQARIGSTYDDCYVGYVFDVSRGRAKALAARSEPGDGDFLSIRLCRFPPLDYMATPGTAWWCSSDLPRSHAHLASSLWTDD
jgi:hypothetical protein